jgi:hypothetical protein
MSYPEGGYMLQALTFTDNELPNGVHIVGGVAPPSYPMGFVDSIILANCSLKLDCVYTGKCPSLADYSPCAPLSSAPEGLFLDDKHELFLRMKKACSQHALTARTVRAG